MRWQVKPKRICLSRKIMITVMNIWRYKRRRYSLSTTPMFSQFWPIEGESRSASYWHALLSQQSLINAPNHITTSLSLLSKLLNLSNQLWSQRILARLFLPCTTWNTRSLWRWIHADLITLAKKKGTLWRAAPHIFPGLRASLKYRSSLAEAVFRVQVRPSVHRNRSMLQRHPWQW